jgi:hypothetical protein
MVKVGHLGLNRGREGDYCLLCEGTHLPLPYGLYDESMAPQNIPVKNSWAISNMVAAKSLKSSGL